MVENLMGCLRIKQVFKFCEELACGSEIPVNTYLRLGIFFTSLVLKERERKKRDD
jgi:hypothetical protein